MIFGVSFPFVLCISAFLKTAAGQDAIPALSVPASQYWDGIDGPWSTFWVAVGTPPQQVRVLPSTSGDHNALWVVLTEGCTSQDPSTCAQDRTVFNPNTSSTWDAIGLFQLGLREEAYLGYNVTDDNAEFANETFTLGNNNGLPTIGDSVVQGFATKDFYMGALGLAARAINVSSFNAPQPSVLQALRNQGNIPSLSWGYTAGNQFADPPTFGSLTLGGYDNSRLMSSGVTVPFGSDQSRDLLIGVQSISSDNTQFLSTGVYAFVDSLVAELWLPQDTCEAFERAFGLTWNDTAELYLVNDSLHDTLTSQNPSITFQVGPASSSSSGSVQIVLPYNAFDLSISPPYVSSSSRYFPLKRAQNSTQYTLGRTFLQYAYVVADYERSQFSVYQAQFPPTSMPQNLTAIYPPGQGPNGSSSSGSSSKKSGLGSGAIAGIAVGVVVLIVGAALLLFFLRRRRTNKTKIAELPANSVGGVARQEDSTYQKPELDATEFVRPELEARTKAELAAGDPKMKPEFYGGDGSTTDFSQAYEMDSLDPKSYARNELPGSPGHMFAHELPAEDVLPPELPTPPALSSRGSTSSSARGSRRSPIPRSGIMHQSSTVSRSSSGIPQSSMMHQSSVASRSSSGAPQSSVMHQSSTASRSSGHPQSAPTHHSASVSSASGAAQSSSGTHHASIISPIAGPPEASRDPNFPPLSFSRSPPPRREPFAPRPPPK